MSNSLLRRFIREVIDGGGNVSTARSGGNLRGGVATMVQRGGNVLDNEAIELQKTAQKEKLAATVLVISDDGKVLAVSRRDDPTAFGLPGGKVDTGETLAQAAARELKEETGLDAVGLKPFFVHREDDGFTTTTFIGSVTGSISTDEEGLVRWVDREVLFNGPFGSYNRRLFKRLDASK